MNRILCFLGIFLIVFSIQADEFALRNSKEGSVCGPFELKDSAVVAIGDHSYTVTDTNKFGDKTFTLSEGDVRYGPFSLIKKTPVTLNGVKYSIYVMPKEKNAADNIDAVRQNAEVIKGKYNSDHLIKFERLLDTVEADFSDTMKLGRGSVMEDYKSRISAFKQEANELQSEVVKFKVKGVDVYRYASSIQKAIEDTDTAYRNVDQKKIKIPKIKSTRRNDRSGAGGILENYSSCTGKNDATVKTDSLALKTSLQTLVSEIAHLREAIIELERTGNWNALKRNGKVFQSTGGN